MLYWLIEHLDHSIFNLLRYISIRAGGAIATAFFVVIFLGAFIRLMIPNQRSGAPVGLEGVSSQVVSRIGTPAICALTLLSAPLVSTVLWANLRNPYVWIAMGAATGFALVGFHDHLQMTLSHSWFSRRTQLLIETVIAIGAWIAIFRIGRGPLVASLMFGEHPVVFGFISLVLSTMVVVGGANAVRLIDTGGRVAIVALMITAVVLGMIAYLTGRVVLAYHLQLPYVAGTRELTIVCAAITGVCPGLVWLKAASTPVLMGDAGSLAIGAALGTVAVAVL